MNVAEFFIDLDKIKNIVERWGDGSDVNALERDLVLDKLKALYEQILFEQPVLNEYANELVEMPTFDMSVEMQEMSEIIDQNAEADKIEEVEPKIEQIVVAEIPEVVDVEIYHETTHETAPEITSEPQQIESQQEYAAQIEIESEAEIEAETEQIELMPESEPEPEPEPEPVSEPETIEVVNQSLFTEESIPVKQKMDRRVILSLYGDEPMQEQYVERTVVKEEPHSEQKLQTEQRPQTEQRFQVESKSQQAEPRLMRDEKSKDVPQLTTVDKPHSTVLGDVIGQGNHTVGDNMMFTVVDRVDVATKVVTEQSTSLRKMIGINDKFLMIRDLFNGDAMSYEQAIAALEVFTDLDDALIYIHESYSWNPNSEGVKLLIELLTRKLS